MNIFLKYSKKIRNIFFGKERYKGIKDAEVLIISHNDVDGIAAASIIRRKYPNSYLITTSPRKLDEVFKAINVEKKKIFIADLSPNESQIKSLEKSLSKLVSKGCEITWIDHHSWPKQNLELISNYVKLVISNTYSASELVYKTLEINDGISKKLVDIANDADEAKYMLEDTININKALRNKRRSKAIFDILSEGKFDDERILKWSREAENNESKIIEYAKNVRYLYTNAGRKFAVLDMRKKDLPGNLVAKHAIQLHDLDFAIVIYSNRSVSLYRGKDNEIDLLSVARIFNGGGHPFACGCYLRLSLKSRFLSKVLGKKYLPEEIKQLIEYAKKVL